MSKTILYIAASLDGCIAGENDNLSFLEYSSGDKTSDHGTIKSFEKFFDNIGAIILGRNTYEWELIHAGENVHPVPKFVFTHSKQLKSAPGVTFTDESPEVALKHAKSAANGRDVWIEGGALIVQQFLNMGLIDEIDLYVFPIILGKGVNLFDNISSEIKLSLIETNSSNGLVQLRYKVIKSLVKPS
jgi:dihydrofolate reductase